MVATNESPVFVKIEGLILMTAIVISLVFTFLDSVRLTEAATDLGLDSYTLLIIRASVSVLMIICTYGLMMRLRLCWVIIIAGFIVMIRFNISNFDIMYNLIPLAVNIVALLTLFRPSVFRYVFRNIQLKKEESQTEE